MRLLADLCSRERSSQSKTLAFASVDFHWLDVLGEQGRKTRHVNEVDADEITVRFYQESYDDADKLVEIHHSIW